MRLTVPANVGATARLPVAREIVAPLLSVTLLALLSNGPSLSVSVPLTIDPVARPTPALLLIVRLLKVVATEPPMLWAPVPLKVTVPLPAVNVPPFLVQLPFTLTLAPAVKVPEV